MRRAVRILAALLFGLATVTATLMFVPQARAATVTGALAQSQVVSITGGYNTTTQMYEQTGQQTVVTNWTFSLQQTVNQNNENPSYAQCTVLAGNQQVTCTSDATNNGAICTSPYPGAIDKLCTNLIGFTGNISVSSQNGNPTFTFSLPSIDPSTMKPVGIFVMPETIYGQMGTGSESYLSSGQSGGWSFNFSNVSDPQDWYFLLEFLANPIVAAIAVPTTQTVPIYSWVTTAVWHPVQISYS